MRGGEPGIFSQSLYRGGSQATQVPVDFTYASIGERVLYSL